MLRFDVHRRTTTRVYGAGCAGPIRAPTTTVDFMERKTEQISIQFLDLTPDRPSGPDENASTGSNRTTMVVATLAVLSAFVLVAMSISGRTQDEPPVSDTVDHSPTATTTTSAPRPEFAPLEADEFVPWPEPPEDHDPIVTIIPGAGEPVFETLTNTTIVYVNSLGRPTVVDLDTGTISNVIIASTRSRDSFAVELGTVVSPDGSSRSIPKATSRAIAFFTFPPGDASFSDGQFAATAPGALLCLSELPCEVTGWQSTKNSRGVDEFRTLTAEEDPDLHEALFGDGWTVDGIYRHPPDGQNQDLRLPIPLNDDVWIVHQPLDSSNASS